MPHHRQTPVYLALCGLLALAAAMGIGRFIYTPILPYMEAQTGLPKDEAGWIAAANYLGYLLGALLAAKRGLPGGERLWFLGGLAGSAASTAAMAAADGLTAFLVLRFLGGLASAFVLVFASVLILQRLAEAGRPGLTALHFAGVGFGIALSALGVWLLADAGVGWRGHWVAGGAVAGIAFLVCLKGVSKAGGRAPAAGRDGAGKLTAPLLRLIVGYGLFGFGYIVTATFIASLAADLSGDATLGAWVWLAVGLAAAPSVAFWIALARRIGEAGAFAVACLVESVGVALSVLSGGAFGLIVAGALLGGTFVSITALGLIRARSLAPGNPTRALALMTAAFGLGQMTGPVVAGELYRVQGDFLLSSLLAALLLVVAAALSVWPSRQGTPT